MQTVIDTQLGAYQCLSAIGTPNHGMQWQWFATVNLYLLYYQ